jgi:hypothetical protein
LGLLRDSTKVREVSYSFTWLATDVSRVLQCSPNKILQSKMLSLINTTTRFPYLGLVNCDKLHSLLEA